MQLYIPVVLWCQWFFEWWTKLNLDCYLFFVVIWVSEFIQNHSNLWPNHLDQFSWLDHRLIKTTERGCKNNNNIFILLSTFPFKTSHFATMMNSHYQRVHIRTLVHWLLMIHVLASLLLDSFYNCTGGSINHSSSACKSQSVSVLTFIFLSRF